MNINDECHTYTIGIQSRVVEISKDFNEEPWQQQRIKYVGKDFAYAKDQVRIMYKISTSDPVGMMVSGGLPWQIAGNASFIQQTAVQHHLDFRLV